MALGDDAIAPLRAALAVSPGNGPLRELLIQTLVKFARWDEAETECRAALADRPDADALKLQLAEIFLKQNKASAALVLCETLIKAREPLPAAYILYARLLFERGEVSTAVAMYKNGIEADPAVADTDLAKQLGIGRSVDSDSFVVEGRERSGGWDGPTSEPVADIERPKTTFADVGGMNSVKDEIGLKIILPLQQPELFKAYGKTAGGGILLYGPPGCGKTHMARATAGEIKSNFISIGINDVLDMWIGNSEKNLHAIFEQARENRPCVLFFDEVDALGGRRTDAVHSGGRNLINQFLAELDGIQQNNADLLILAATNAPWHVDPAFRRPGRFDRVLFIPPPDEPARREILEILLRGKPCETIDYAAVAAKTPEFSGADLSGLVNQAIEQKLREALKAGGLKPLTTKDLLGVAKTVKPTTKEWFATARNYALYSNQGGAYDDVLKYLKL